MTNYSFIDKSVIRRTVIVEGEVIAVSPLRIGAGKENFDPASLARDSVLKDSSGRPIIPGSSWKGVFRSAGERILRNKNVEVCSGIGRDYCLNNYRKARDFESALRNNDINEALDIFWNYTCLNCKLFGTMSVMGNVRFLDSLPITYSLNTRTMVAISRTEGAAARGALVTVEYVEPGSKFNFKMIGVNLPNYAIGYLVAIMKQIHEGFVQIGGHKSRGFGFVKFGLLKFVDQGNKKIGDEDLPVSVGETVEAEGDKFFEKMKPFMEVFDRVKIPYPKK